ncbi:MAG: DUF4189 domain-containing protein [Pseudomonas sp.]|uniref:DUF4189 domain-containing protein n=1 Tax=Stenotrophomonas sp. TaxID=69392 RepID=UPI003D6D9510
MKIVLAIFLLILSSGVRAEGACPPGQYPVGGQGVQGCAPIPGAGAWQQSPGNASYLSQMEDAAATAIAAAARAANKEKIRQDTTRDWWGVIVVSTQDGVWNASLNAKTTNDATVDAMTRCKGTCTPVLSFANSCMAPAYSSEGGMYWSPGESREKAAAGAVAVCTAKGGTGCESPPKEAFCSGWKYAYSGRERFSHRLLLEAKGDVAPPKLVEFPGAKEYVAKPLGRRGAATAMATVKLKNEDGSTRDWTDEELSPQAEGMTRLAKQWIAIATSARSNAFDARTAPSEQDAKENALSNCGADCSILVTASHGQCFVVIRAPQPGGRFASFAGLGSTSAEAEEVALSDCIGSNERACPIVLSECLK